MEEASAIPRDELGDRKLHLPPIGSFISLSTPWLVLMAVPLWIVYPVLKHPFQEIVGGIPDAFQYTWYLGWFWHAVLHGTNPLTSLELNWPTGFGLMYNTSVLAESILFGWMVGLTSGVFVYNLLIYVNLAAVALLGYQICREMGIGRWLATWAGTMLSFMPYLAAEDMGHLSQYFISPILAILLVAIRYQHGKFNNAMMAGCCLGLLLDVEFYTSLELFATFLLAITLLFILLYSHRTGRVWLYHQRGFRSRPFWLALITVTVLFTSPGLYTFVVSGGMHYAHHEFHSQSSISGAADLISPLIPTALQAVHTSSTSVLSNRFPTNVAERGTYIGLPLLLGVPFLFTYWRNAVSKALLYVCGLLFILSLGAYLHVGGRMIHVPLPWIVFAHVPLLDSALPIRLAVYVDIALIVWSAYALHLIFRNSTLCRTRAKWGAVFVALFSLISWMPAIPYPHARTYTLPPSVVRMIGTRPTVWLSPNFGYDMEALAASGYRVNTYNMYGFARHPVLHPGTFRMSPSISKRHWSRIVDTLRTNLPGGYVVFVPFPVDAPPPQNLTNALLDTLGEPVANIKGCMVWLLRK